MYSVDIPVRRRWLFFCFRAQFYNDIINTPTVENGYNDQKRGEKTDSNKRFPEPSDDKNLCESFFIRVTIKTYDDRRCAYNIILGRMYNNL